jgi:hypothetical protein
MMPNTSDLPQAQRVIGADVADVYALIADPKSWPTWIDSVSAPVKELRGDVFEVSATTDGVTRTHRVEVKARGPVHTWFADVDDMYRVEWRTRPDLGGTFTHVVAAPIGKRRWWQFGAGKRPSPEHQTARLKDLLAQLAAHFEQRSA